MRFIHEAGYPRISVKDGVEVDRLSPFLKSRLVPLSHLWAAFFPHDVDGVTITSGHEGFRGDGVHGQDSLHYLNEEGEGNALDIRTFDVKQFRIAEFRHALSLLLGPEFDIVWETKVPHLHIEYDPKVPSARTHPPTPQAA